MSLVLASGELTRELSLYAAACVMPTQEQRAMPELPFLNTVALDILIECFSEDTGDLIYDSDCRACRMLTDHDMFFVRDREGAIHTHLLNANDYFIGYDDKINVPFVEPVLRVSDNITTFLYEKGF